MTTISISGTHNDSNLVLTSENAVINNGHDHHGHHHHGHHHHGHHHHDRFIGDKFQAIVQKSNTGQGTAFVICEFKLDPAWYPHMVAYEYKQRGLSASLPAGHPGIDASWSDMLDAVHSDLGTAMSSVKLGIEILTSFHWSFDIDDDGLPKIDASDNALWHVTHIYPSVLDMITVWTNNSTGKFPGPLSPAASATIMPAYTNYIEFVNMPLLLENEWRKVFNRFSPYSGFANPHIFNEDGTPNPTKVPTHSIFRYGRPAHIMTRPEVCRDGVIDTTSIVRPPMSNDGTEKVNPGIDITVADTISEASFWDFNAVPQPDPNPPLKPLSYWESLLSLRMPFLKTLLKKL